MLVNIDGNIVTGQSKPQFFVKARFGVLSLAAGKRSFFIDGDIHPAAMCPNRIRRELMGSADNLLRHIDIPADTLAVAGSIPVPGSP